MTTSNDSVANYAAEHYDKVNEDYKDVVDYCRWHCCSEATMCCGCLRRIKKFASIDEKKWPVYEKNIGTQTQEMANQEESESEVDEDEYWARHCV